MKKAGIYILYFTFMLIFLTKLAFAQGEFSINYPSEITTDEEFDVEVIATGLSERSYDIKVWILIKGDTSSVTERYSEDEDRWEGGRYYVDGFLKGPGDQSRNMKIRIIEEFKDYEGEAIILVKPRTGNSIEDTINIVASHGAGGGDGSGNDSGDDSGDDDSDESSVSIDMDWEEDEIINGEEFDIELILKGLKDESYDIKLWIRFKDNNTVITDRYDEEINEWKSGRYYISDLIEGPGEESEFISLRIREEYKDYEGDAKLFCKVRGSNEVFEESVNIEILDEKIRTWNVDNDETDKENNKKEETYEEYIERKSKEWGDEIETLRNNSDSMSSITGGVISLGGSDEENEENQKKKGSKVLYESKSEIIKKYAVYGFTLLIVALCVLLAFDRLK